MQMVYINNRLHSTMIYAKQCTLPGSVQQLQATSLQRLIVAWKLIALGVSRSHAIPELSVAVEDGLGAATFASQVYTFAVQLSHRKLRD